MTYKPLLAVQIADPRDVYGDVTAPTVTFSETMREANRLDTVTRSGVRYDEALSCLYLEPQYAPVSETLGDWTTTSGHTFKAVKHAVSETNVIKHTAWASGHETEEWVAYRGTGTAFGEGSGYWIALYMDAPKPGTTRTADDIYVTAGFAAVSSLAYRVKWAFGLAPRLERTIDGGTNWLAVADLPMGDGGTSTTGSGGELILQVLKMNGSLIFRAGQAVNAMAETGVAVPSMAVNFPITVTGKGCHAAFGAWPVTWPTSGVFVSDESPKPWYNTTTPVITIDGSASGITAAMTTSGTDWTLQYSLTLAPTSAVSPCVRQVKIYIPVVQSNPSAIPPWATLSGVYGFELNHAFDPVETSVHISGHVRVRNHEGQYGSAYGERACRIIAGYLVNGVPLWQSQRFMGILGMDGECGEEDAYLSLDDRSTPLRTRALLNPPYQDGDCIYHAVKEYAEYAGIHTSWFAVGPGAPSDSWTCDGVTCNPATHYRLGVGTGFQPLWREAQGSSVWAAIQHIRQRYGMAVRFTPGGYFTMYPWQPWLARTAWTPVNSFDLVEHFDLNGYPLLSQMVGPLRKRWSTRETRNSLALMGLDQSTWRPITSNRWDSPSIFGNGLGALPPNYMGRIANAIDSSSVYSDVTMTGAIADRVFNALRQPRVTFMPLTVFGQPLNVLDYVAIGANRAMPNGWDKFFVSSMAERWLTQGPAGVQSYMMTLGCDLIPYDLPTAGASDSAA